MQASRMRRDGTSEFDPQQALGNVRFQAVNPDTANYLTEHR